MPTFTAVFDACVLYPMVLRGVLMELARTGLFRARWTNDIHEEWIAALLKVRPDIKREQLERTRQLMDEYALEPLVTGYESLIEGLTLPDPNDRHVLAAAIRCSAGVIVTRNLKHFPEATLEPFGLEAQHPDQFIDHLCDLDERAVVSAIRTQRAAYKNPPLTEDEFLAALERQGLTETVRRLRAHPGTL